MTTDRNDNAGKGHMTNATTTGHTPQPENSVPWGAYSTFGFMLNGGPVKLSAKDYDYAAHCVNTHDAMLEALRMAAEAYDAGPSPAAVRAEMDSAIDYIRAAIRRAPSPAKDEIRANLMFDNHTFALFKSVDEARAWLAEATADDLRGAALLTLRRTVTALKPVEEDKIAWSDHRQYGETDDAMRNRWLAALSARVSQPQSEKP